MNGAANTSTRALVHANPRRLSALRPRAVARHRLLSLAAALTRVANARLRRPAFLSRSVLLRLLSYAREPLVLAAAEAGGIRNTEPPMSGISWKGARKDNRRDYKENKFTFIRSSN